MEISPFSSGTGTSKNWYNGKEIQDDFGLYWYDYGARFYDPALARFHSVDPLAESFPWQSVYVYADNNPIRYVDVNGMAAGEPPYGAQLVLGMERAGLSSQQTSEVLQQTGRIGLMLGGIAADFTPADAVVDAGEMINDISKGDYGSAVLSGLAIIGLDFIKDAKKIINAADEVVDGAKTLDNAADAGRTGKQARLKEIATDDKASSADKGWIKSEMNQIDKGKRKSIRNPPGKEMAHERGREAAKGYSYEHSNLQDKDLHKLQHKYDKNGTLNKERPINK